MDELLDWKHIAGPNPDLSTVVKQHNTDYLYSTGPMSLDRFITKDHSVHPSVCPSDFH